MTRERVLVTGNMGYIGPMLGRAFADSGAVPYLIGLDNGYFGHCLSAPGPLPELAFDEQRFLDLRDAGEEQFAGVDTVIHLAAISNDPMGKSFEAATESINAEGSAALARLAKKAGVRHFVFSSSCSMYGAAGEGAVTEQAPLTPLTAYARSKAFMEKELQGLAGEGFTVSCLRFATACGWSPRTRLDLVLNDFVASAVASGRIEVLSDGSPWRPLIHIEDMARALVWASRRSPDAGGTFLAVNVGRNDWNYQVKALAEAVADVIPGTEVSINRDAAPDRRSYRVDFSLLEKLAPPGLIRWTLEKTVRDLHENFLGIGFADRNFRASSLVRLVELQRLKSAGRLDDNLRWVRG